MGIGVGKGDASGLSRRWSAEAAELPCTIEVDGGGEWIVTIASASLARSRDLETAIVRAGGGLVSGAEAAALAAAVARLGSVSVLEPGPVAQVAEPSALDGGDADRNLPGPPTFLSLRS